MNHLTAKAKATAAAQAKPDKEAEARGRDDPNLQRWATAPLNFMRARGPPKPDARKKKRVQIRSQGHERKK